MPKIAEFCHLYINYRRDAKPAEVFYKGILSPRAPRPCGEILLSSRPTLAHFRYF
jgi:hypothetical protein